MKNENERLEAIFNISCMKYQLPSFFSPFPVRLEFLTALKLKLYDNKFMI